MKLVHRTSALLRPVAAPALVLVLGLLAIATIAVLQSRSTASRHAELKLAAITLALSKLQVAPFQAHVSTGGSPIKARRLIDAHTATIDTTLAALERDSPPAALRQTRGPLRTNSAAIEAIYALGASDVGYGREADQHGTKSRRVSRTRGS
jgi:hypothetical protein